MRGRSLHLAGNLAGLVGGLVTAPLTARALGPEGRGHVAVVVVVATVLMTVSALGLPWLARADLAHDPLALTFWRRRARLVALVLVPVGVLISWGVVLWSGLSGIEAVAALAVIVLASLAAARGIEGNALVTGGRADLYGFANVAAALLTVTTVVVAFIAGVLDVAVVLWTTAASAALQLMLTVTFVHIAVRGRRSELDARARELSARPEHRGRALVSRASRAWASQVGEALGSRGDTLAVAASGTTAAVGLYSVVALVPQIAYAIYTTVVQASYSRRRSGDSLDRFRHVFQTCTAAALLIAVLAGPAAWWGVPVVFGAEFTAAREFVAPGLAMTIALSVFAPVIQHLSEGHRNVLPLAGIVLGAAGAAFVGGVLMGPTAAIGFLAGSMFVGCVGYATWLTRGAVLRVSATTTARWWRGQAAADA